MKRVYMADKLRKKTKIYAIIGKPLSGSISYLTHNLAFKHENFDAVYINLELDSIKEILPFKEILSGFSVTMPYKEEIVKYLDDMDEDAKNIGSVNTVVNRNGRLIGYNTDMAAAVNSLKEKIEIKGKTALILGAGGASRAVSYGILKEGGRLIISNRNEKKGKKLAKELKVEFKNLNEVDFDKIDILINATSVGMLPEINKSLVKKDNLKNIVVFDMVYNPAVTKLLHDAQRNNCKTVNGLDMFTSQAIEQFKLFTGISPDRKEFEQIILENRLR